ncbi:hypothetical protein E0K83_15855 [Gramella sp. BOM4]|nr:hypothetical protein [Christiangramia bathymodioli]
MKNLFVNALLVLSISIGLTSCRNAEAEEDESSEIEQLMNDPENEVEIKDNGDKIKIETPEGTEVKIKKDGDEYKQKIDRADGSESKVKVDGDEVKVKTDN